MSQIEKFKQSAEILQQVDVTDIVRSLAMGIAEAQAKLDDNSVKQTLALADKQINGKSLLELGFTPAFYHFQEAEVSASINLKMRLATDFDISGSAELDFNKQGGYTKENLDYLREDRSSQKRTEFRSSRSFMTKASNSKSLKIQESNVTMNQTEGSVSMVEDMADQVRNASGVERAEYSFAETFEASNRNTGSSEVIIENAGGYIVITAPDRDEAESVLKVSDYDAAETVSYKTTGSEFDLGSGNQDTFDKVFDAINGLATDNTVIGFTGTNYRTNGLSAPEELKLYFDFDKRDAKTAFTTLNDGGPQAHNQAMVPVFSALAKALKGDTNLQIKIYGHTDPKASNGYNLSLGQDRANSLKEWLKTKGAPESQMTAESKGEQRANVADPNADQPDPDFRMVTIEITSGADYFYTQESTDDFLTVGELATSLTGADNTFIYAKGDTISGGPISFDVQEGGSGKLTINTSGTSATDLASNLSGDTTKFYSEVIGSSVYLMHKETKIKYTAYSASEETLEISESSSGSTSSQNSQSTYQIDDNVNQLTSVRKDLDKLENPSTIAVGASVDVSYARKFDMTVEGNSSVRAKLVSIPAPPEFLDEIKSYLSPSGGGTTPAPTTP